jgi:CHAT domain
MDSPQAAALRLAITSNNDTNYTVTASVPGSDRPWVNWVSGTELKEIRLGYADALLEFKRHVGNDLAPPDWDKIARAMQTLRRVNGRLIAALAGPNVASFTKFLGSALSPPRDPPSAPLVEIHAPSTVLFPFELIQVHPGDWPVAIVDRKTLLQACKSFIGFSAVVRRVSNDLGQAEAGLDQNRILPNRKRLRLTFFQEAVTLKGTLQEIAFFTGRAAFFDFRAWPQVDSESILSGLATQLWDSRAGLDGAIKRPNPDAVQHFACHFGTSEDNPLTHTIILAAPNSQRHAITLGQLQAEFGITGQHESEDAPTPRPLVFLNGCGSAALAAGFGTSFVQWFLRIKARGVIGTETLVPDKFAATFSARFYLALLKGLRAGQALVLTKHSMVKDYGNPLGMIYTMYADPDLHTEIQVDEGLLNEL